MPDAGTVAGSPGAGRSGGNVGSRHRDLLPLVDNFGEWMPNLLKDDAAPDDRTAPDPLCEEAGATNVVTQ